MTAFDDVVIEPNRDQNIASEGFGQSQCLTNAGRDWDDETALWQAAKDLFDQAQAVSDLMHTDPGARVDIAFGQHRNFEHQCIVWGVPRVLARIERAARGTAHKSARAEAPREFRLQNTRGDRS